MNRIKKMEMDDEKLYSWKMIRIHAWIRLGICVMCMVCTFTFIFGMNICKEEGMAPSVKPGDLILFFRMQHKFQEGDVVVFHKENKDKIGRIQGKFPDEILITENGKLVVNGYVQATTDNQTTYPLNPKIKYPIKIKKDHYFVLGDCREKSKDSRTIGCLSQKQIKGKVISILRRRSI